MHSNSLSKRIFIGLFSGLLLGTTIQFLLADVALFSESLVELATLGGQLFVNLIMLMVVPLVFVSIVSGVCELPDVRAFGRLGSKTFGLYIINTVMAIAAAVAISLIFQPGLGANLVSMGEGAQIQSTDLPNIGQLILNIVPRNPVTAFASGNMLQVIFMALLLGIAIKKLGSEVQGVARGFGVANRIMMTLITMVMSLAPYGVFCLMLKLGATLEASTFLSVLSYMGLILGLLLLWLFVVYPVVVSLTTEMSAAEFRRKTREQVLFSFSTASSNATIPVTMRTLVEKMKVNKATAGFGVPLGATMNMSGVSIYITIAAFFLANAYGAPITMAQLPALVTSCFLLSVGAGGVPGGGMVMIGVLIHQMGLPVEAFALVAALDRVIDMVLTSTNVVGDTAVVTIVDRSESRQALLEERTELSG
ncbi:dicarboxylate/amino acid:cation symporter [Ferrimonas sp.]|uniref:dicarboxylate/amino acid:cation symporter n=1 Tax=Ferrimonas sp. TaxID=2080861 RepID=UPI003A8D518C